jgi:hypothetical protein
MNTPDSPLEGLVPHEMIAIRAHQLWVQRGCPAGQAEQDWFTARAELEQELTVQRDQPVPYRKSA